MTSLHPMYRHLWLRHPCSSQHVGHSGRSRDGCLRRARWNRCDRPADLRPNIPASRKWDLRSGLQSSPKLIPGRETLPDFRRPRRPCSRQHARQSGGPRDSCLHRARWNRCDLQAFRRWDLCLGLQNFPKLMPGLRLSPDRVIGLQTCPNLRPHLFPGLQTCRILRLHLNVLLRLRLCVCPRSCREGGGGGGASGRGIGGDRPCRRGSGGGRGCGSRLHRLHGLRTMLCSGILCCNSQEDSDELGVQLLLGKWSSHLDRRQTMTLLNRI
ncbi:hypothetical protein B0H21DRAFT_764467 [Amylocystis lapponica]|nr:hypothetical protein B0H21DRAFT_764467 [Amylocystis lapponica]